jgi:hypothetical protein
MPAWGSPYADDSTGVVAMAGDEHGYDGGCAMPSGERVHAEGLRASDAR